MDRLQDTVEVDCDHPRITNELRKVQSLSQTRFAAPDVLEFVHSRSLGNFRNARSTTRMLYFISQLSTLEGGSSSVVCQKKRQCRMRGFLQAGLAYGTPASHTARKSSSRRRFSEIFDLQGHEREVLGRLRGELLQAFCVLYSSLPRETWVIGLLHILKLVPSC